VITNWSKLLCFSGTSSENKAVFWGLLGHVCAADLLVIFPSWIDVGKQSIATHGSTSFFLHGSSIFLAPLHSAPFRTEFVLVSPQYR